MTTDKSMTPSEAYDLLQRMFAVFMNPQTKQDDLAEFLTPDYVQRVDGKQLDYNEFLMHHQALQRTISSGSVNFEHFVTDGVSAATVHTAEAVKRTGERIRLRVIAYYQFCGNRISLVDELTQLLNGEQEDRDLGSRTVPA
ncbi:nuclear transport factor 2 family protein [Tsuneonella flava]|uniref:Nuclear transport factor 2 family protein n=1 Tax=Tsuneonella flava TaxID=2055955 RepID=A0ABX7K924_9SPHN|nr:nuclear transport factor 2 family protein [Tsuneonella flava]QSB44343.1 nuclear transport factor 2 family protein [Tsuneonella flava]